MGTSTIIALSDSQRRRVAPAVCWAPTREEDTTQFVLPPFAEETAFREDPLLLHTRVIRALWGIDHGAAEAHRRLRPFDGQAKDLSRADVAVMAARGALAISDLVDDAHWGGVVWPLLRHVAGHGSLNCDEWRLLDQATAHLDTRDHALYTVRGAARRWLSTTQGAAHALQRLPDKARYLDFLVDLAALTSR